MVYLVQHDGLHVVPEQVCEVFGEHALPTALQCTARNVNQQQ